MPKENLPNPSNQKNPGSVFFLGLMGCGKSFWADKLGTSLNISAFHLDDEIERSEQKTILEIFAKKGEDYFRNKETEMLKNFSNKKNFFLSVGGGTPCFNNNMNWMNENGTTIWIDESIGIITERLRKEKLHRPIIADIPDKDLFNFLTILNERRSKFYSLAQHRLTKNITEESFIKILLPDE